MAEIDVAVVIVSYRSAALTIDCLRSIHSQRGAPGLRVRCVVVDNASGDAPAVAEAIAANGWAPWARLVVAERNGGFAYGNNLGIATAHATGRPDYVHLLNPDTVLRPNAIEALVRFLEARPDAGIAGGAFENADASRWAVAFRFPSLIAEIAQGTNMGVVQRLFRRWEVSMAMGDEPRAVDWLAKGAAKCRRCGACVPAASWQRRWRVPGRKAGKCCSGSRWVRASSTCSSSCASRSPVPCLAKAARTRTARDSCASSW